MSRVVDFVRREVYEELKLPKFACGSELSEHNLDNYREILTGRNGRALRFMAKMYDMDLLRPYIDLSTQSDDCRTGFIGKAILGYGRSFEFEQEKFDAPVVPAPKNRAGEEIAVSVLNVGGALEVNAMSVSKHVITEDGSIDYWYEVRFDDDRITTKDSRLPESKSLSPTVLDYVASGVKIVEKGLK